MYVGHDDQGKVNTQPCGTPEPNGCNEFQGEAYIFNGATGTLIRRIEDPTPQNAAFFGQYAIATGDLNGDGSPDFVVAAPNENVGVCTVNSVPGKPCPVGAAYAFDEPSGSLGYNHTSAGDLNGDGTPDVLASRFIFPPTAYAPLPPPGAAAYIFDGRTGAVLETLPGMSQNGPGNEIASPGDVNGDGYPDYFLGGRLLDGGAGFGSGQVIVELSTPPPASPAPGPSPPAPSPTPPAAPVVTHFTLTNNPFVVSAASTPLVAIAAGLTATHKKGTTITYTVSTAATVTIAISRVQSGRRAHGMCVAPTHKLRHARLCPRTSLKGMLTRNSHSGINRVPFSGRIGAKALKPGHYGATLTAYDATEKASKPVTITFTIVKH
ncbi:MAG: VCBS repeat-containing protein [Actinomycetota bacterium]|nr:VCBS repeat-containing protein [Actinomycetota bacterium]